MQHNAQCTMLAVCQIHVFAVRIQNAQMYFVFQILFESILHNTADMSVFPDVNIYSL